MSSSAPVKKSDCVTRSQGVCVEFHPASLMTSLGVHAHGWETQHGGELVGVSTQAPQMSLVQSASVHLSDLKRWRDGVVASCNHQCRRYAPLPQED